MTNFHYNNKEVESVDNEIEQTIIDSGLKLDKDGNATDSEGNIKKSEDGKIKKT